MTYRESRSTGHFSEGGEEVIWEWYGRKRVALPPTSLAALSTIIRPEGEGFPLNYGTVGSFFSESPIFCQNQHSHVLNGFIGPESKYMN